MNFYYNFVIFFGISIPCLCYNEELRITGELRKACSKRGNAKQPLARVNTTSRLLDLRKHMQMATSVRDLPIDAYIITSDDEHQSEFVDEHDRRIEFISGFSGSYGTVVVTIKKAALWTDGRYHLQADEQMNCDWLLLREGQRKIPSLAEWLHNEFPNGARIGADPKLISESMWRHLQAQFKYSGLKLIALERNLIDYIWKENRPPKRSKSVFALEDSYTGEPWLRKVNFLRTELRALHVNAMVVTALDEIAWLLNIRGRDVPYSPFVRSYVIVDMVRVLLFVNETQLLKNNVTDMHFRIGEDVTPHSVVIRNYTSIWMDLPTYTQEYEKVLLPSFSVFTQGASHAIYELVPKHKQVPIESPIILMKAIKNPTETEGMKNAHIRDGAAMCEFFSYFEKRFYAGDTFTESDVVKLLDEHRFAQVHSLGNSFRTIVAFGSNGAYPKYENTPNTDLTIFDNSTLVIDSGGQYYDGTTDVTRTIHLGTPTEDQKKAYTRVLIGKIAFSSLTFPENMKTSDADVVVRAPLWEVGLDYLYGTSHGVGSFLAVHESPISMHFNSPTSETFHPGYFLAIEPGYYREGDFGVRLENVLQVIQKPWLQHSSGYSYLGFHDITLVPFEPKLMEMKYLSPHHRRWINSYNQRIRDLVGRELKLQNLTNGFHWMMEKTKYIPENISIRQAPCLALVVVFNFILIF